MSFLFFPPLCLDKTNIQQTKSTLIESLQAFTETEIERDPVKYLAKDRRLAAPLLEGAAARADIYPATEADIDRYIMAHLADAEAALREIRRSEIGEDAAREEEAKGNRSDEAYAADAEVRRRERAKQFAEQLRLQKKLEREAEKKAELESLKARAAALEKEKIRLERENARRAERDALRKKEEEKKKERLKLLEEEREKKKKEREAEEKKLAEERAIRKKKEDEEEAKRLEAEAERMLLRESQRMMEPSKARRDRDHSDDDVPAPPSHREYAADKRLSSVRDARDRKEYRAPSPNLDRDRYPPRRDDRDRGRVRHVDERDIHARRESRLRQISAERKAWQKSEDARKAAEAKREAAPPPPPRDSVPVRARSRSPPRGPKKIDRSRSPLARSERDRYRDSRARSRTRSPGRRSSYRERDRDRDYRRRSRSRSPRENMDRYLPGVSRRRDDDHRYSTRERDDERYSTRDRERDRDRDRDYDRRRHRDSRDYDDPARPSDKEIDRYIPTNSRLAERGETSMGPSARGDSRSERPRSPSKEHRRERDVR